jgi:putative flippase GtrA
MTAFLTNPAERERFFKFAIVGAIGTIVDVSIMNLLVALAHLTLVTAGTISFICAVISNFTWNRFWTYPESRSKHFIGQLGQFGLVNAVGLLIRYPILKFGEPLLDQIVTNLVKFTTVSHQFVSHNLTLACAIGSVMLWNYFANRHWTYNDIEI